MPSYVDNAKEFGTIELCVRGLACAWGLSFKLTESENSFNGEPQAQAKYGNDACGLPLND
jgi:hypothetical protein